jgi:hypothetical protein
LFRKELVGSYPDVASLTRLITSDTRLVVIDPGLISAISAGALVDRHKLLARSVQLWSNKIRKLALNQIGHRGELYAWEYDYDPKFLGIMAGVLKMNQVDHDGYAFV